MADTPYPLPKSIRQTEWLVGDGSLRYGPFGEGWGIFDEGDVLVETRLVGSVDFAPVECVIEKASSARYASFYVNFPTALTSAKEYRVKGLREHERDLAVTRGGAIDGPMLELELSKQSVVLQEQRRDVDVATADILRTLRVPDGEVMPELPAGVVRGGYGLGFAAGTGNPVLLPSTPVEVTGNTSPPMVVASGLVPTSTSPATRAANRAYLQALINDDPTRNICIPFKGGWPATEMVYHFDGTLSWPDGYPPVMCGESVKISLHFWSVDTTRVTYWKDASGISITPATAAGDPGAVVVTQYSDAAGNPITEAQAADVVNYPGATSAAYRDIKAFIFFSGKASFQRCDIRNLTFVPRMQGDVLRISALFIERTETIGTSDSPMLRDVLVGRTGAHTALAITYTACWIGFELRGWSSAELHNLNFAGVEPWFATQANRISTARLSQAGIYTGESFNHIPCINPITENSSIYSCRHAWLYEGEFSEGGKSLKGNYQECNYGIAFFNGGGTSQPYFTITGSHINANVRNVLFKGPRFIQCSGNYFAIKRDTGSADTVAVEIKGSPLSLGGPAYQTYGNVIADNVFNSYGVAGTSIAVDADYVHGLSVTNNWFYSANIGIRFGVNTFDCYEHGNHMRVHPQETDAAKLAVTGASFLDDQGAENNGVTRITADAATTANCYGDGLILDTAVLTANRVRTLKPVDVGGRALTMITRRSTDAFRADYFNPDGTTVICSLYANQFAIVRFDGANLVKMAVGKMDDDGESSINVITSIVNVSVVIRNGGQVFHTGLLTSNINMNLQPTDAKRSDVVRVTRFGGGAFTLTVRDATVVTNAKALNTNEWCDFMFDGTAWLLTTP